MTIIQCISPCIYEREGECTLTHVSSVSNPPENGCAYFRDKSDDKKEDKIEKHKITYY